jgi:hypothetical protein
MHKQGSPELEHMHVLLLLLLLLLPPLLLQIPRCC